MQAGRVFAVKAPAELTQEDRLVAGLPVADATTTGGDSQRSSGDGSDGEAGVVQSGVVWYSAA